jgi:L-asparaginase II
MVNMQNPVLIELTRGSLVECTHAGAVAVVRSDGQCVAALGDIASPVYPRSAIKMLQALVFVESGAVEHFGMGAAEIAIASASHAGTPRHVAVVEGMLSRAGLDPVALGCGAHEPLDGAAAKALIKIAAMASALHHNCSGKHAAMLVTAAHLREPTQSYWRPDHPVQVRVRSVLEDFSGARLANHLRGIDGCSVPNWALPLTDLAHAFARFATGVGLTQNRARACRHIAQACWAHPDLVAGPNRMDTRMMQALTDKVLIKTGAEGVYCGALAELGLGFALKIDDGAKRAAEAVAARLITCFYPAASAFGPDPILKNWRGLEVGEVRASAALAAMLAKLH